MKPVRLYFAGPVFNPKGERGKELNRRITNRLVSYLYPKQLKEWCRQVPALNGNIILDSGAFSAWAKGHSISIDAYISYAKEAIQIAADDNKKLRVVNLDVIPGSPGTSTHLNRVKTAENKKIINTAAAKGYENLLRMKDAGITPIHVFHQGEDWEWLHKMVELTDYIGVSPANDMSVQSRLSWMRSVFSYIHRNRIRVKTHGFAVWMLPVLKTLPFTSADAATWRIVAAWGSIMYPIGGFKNPDYSKQPMVFCVSKQRSTKGMGVLTPRKLKQIEDDGYTYDEIQSFDVRCEINIRYILGLEQWVNEYRKGVQFQVSKGLFTI